MSAIYDPEDLLLGTTGTRCYLSPREAQQLSGMVATLHGCPMPQLVWECPIPNEAIAVTLQRAAAKHCVIGFESRGVPLEVLAHELAHAIYFAEGEVHHTHDDAFAVLMCLVGWQIIDAIAETQWEWL